MPTVKYPSSLRLASVAALTTLLCACSTPPKPYVAPAAAPKAEVRSALYSGIGRNSGVDVYVYSPGQGGPNGLLYTVRGEDSKPAGYVPLEAGRLLQFSYHEFMPGNRYCAVSFKAMLEPGKRYTLNGGFNNEPGLIPILMDKRTCRMGLTDDATGLPVLAIPVK